MVKNANALLVATHFISKGANAAIAVNNHLLNSTGRKGGWGKDGAVRPS